VFHVDSHYQPEDIRLILDNLQQRRQWSDLWEVFLNLPVKYGLPLLAVFADADWQPSTPREQAFFKGVLALAQDVQSKGVLALAQDVQSVLPTPGAHTFANWLTGEAIAEWVTLSTAELQQRLKTAPPPQGVSIVAALATHEDRDASAIEAVAGNPHWLVRLAGHATGLIPNRPSAGVEVEPAYWVQALVTLVTDRANRWPAEASFADLESLMTAPVGPWPGDRGVACALLQVLMLYHLTEVVSRPLITLLVRVLNDGIAHLQTAVEWTLRHLNDAQAIDALCELAIANPGGAVAKLCVETGYRPHDRGRAALFLFVTRQLGAYFALDSGFERLREAYNRAEPVIQDYVREVIRTGDPQLLDFFTRLKPLVDCTAEEIQSILSKFQQKQDWSAVWQVFLELPLKYSLPELGAFLDSDWRPADSRQQRVYAAFRALADADKTPQGIAALQELSDPWPAKASASDLATLDKALSQAQVGSQRTGLQLLQALFAYHLGRDELEKPIEQTEPSIDIVVSQGALYKVWRGGEG
jgi:hypothetical protein